ncbi:tetratricopeptide repeat protein [Nocardia seriolae]|uniref:tetratricopeptide repeat protein n=1 Tax=Nocardia seriolae TaxID=37332 RepID=UPI002954AEBF|nr:tetratricopeptide repeat protein [Nocardia seriolae]BEK84680.1 tetratricopeptide repeat protein [Nocardia seriolae]
MTRAERRITKADRRRLRERLAATGLSDAQLLPLLVGELRQQGLRPRAAWRYAAGLARTCGRREIAALTLEDVAEAFNGHRAGRRRTVQGNQISHYERWPAVRNGPRLTVEVLEVLAAIYGTTWEELVDTEDLAHLAAADVERFRDAVTRRTTLRADAPIADLPPREPNFIGRREAVREIERRVTAHRHDRSAPSVHVIHGHPGVGKTTLARFAEALFAPRYPDGRIWVDLHGYTPGQEPRKPADVLEQLLLEIGVPRETIPADLVRRSDKWRNAMRTKQMYLTFDNAADSDHVRDLLPLSAGSLVVVTSRTHLTKLAGADPLPLDAMNSVEAEQLLVRLAGLPPGYDRDAAQQIVRTAGNLPLAIKLIAGHIAYHGESMLAAFAADFAELTERNTSSDRAGDSPARHILDRFSAEDESVRAAFELSYRRLRDPDLQRLVRLLGSFPGSEITAEILGAMAAISVDEAKSLINRLSEAGLLDVVPGSNHPSRYRMHDLNRLCAQLRAEHENQPEDRRVAVERIIAHSLTVARQAATLRPFDSAGSPYPATSSLDAATHAREWLSRERELLLDCLPLAGITSDTADLARLLACHLCSVGHWSDADRLYDRALSIADQLTDPVGRAWALLGRGRIQRLRGNHERAEATFAAAHRIGVELSDRRIQVESLCERGQSEWITGDYELAREHFQEALAISREIGHRQTECDALEGLSQAERMASRYRRAEEYSLEALAIASELADLERLGTAQWGYAEVVRLWGQFDVARQPYLMAQRIARSIEHRKMEGDALRGLGHVERMVGNADVAAKRYGAALEIGRRIGDQYSAEWSLWGLGNLARGRGDHEEARDCFREAYVIAKLIDDPLGRIDTLRGLGHTYRQGADRAGTEDYRLARLNYEESLQVAERIGDQLGKADGLRALGKLACRIGDRAAARELLDQAYALYAEIESPRAELLRSERAELGC